jgi:hypothetical protein
MTGSDSESRRLIDNYLESMTGRSKAKDLILLSANDPTYTEHVCQAEAALPGT